MSKQYFLTKSSYTKFIESKFDSFMSAFLTELQTSTSGDFDDVFNVKSNQIEGDCKTYTITINGDYLYTIARKRDRVYITYDTEFTRYSNTVFGYCLDNSFEVKNVLGIRVVEFDSEFNIGEIVSKFVSDIRSSIMQGIMHKVTENDKRYDTNKFSTRFEVYYDATIKKDKIDSRYLSYKGIDANTLRVTQSFKPKEFSYAEFIDIVSELKRKAMQSVDTIYDSYEQIKESIGGVRIILDSKTILCHKSFMPVIGGGFITFKCPYRNSMISMKSTNYNEVIVDGLDEVYGSNESIVLIGNN